MLTRLRRLLDNNNMHVVYTTFIRPILEYGSVQFMGASPVHLNKLDAIQRTAERIGCFKVESLQSRREAAAVSFTLKLLAGEGRGVLNNFAPTMVDQSKGTKRVRDSRHALSGLQIVSRSNTCSLDAYKRGYLGSIHQIWAKLPHEITEQGSKVGWKKITKACKLFLTNKNKKVIVKNRKPKITKDVKVVNGGFDAIDDFIIDNKFEKEMNNLNLSLQIKV